MIALTTSVEWSVGFIAKRLKNPLPPKPKEQNETAHTLRELDARTGSNKIEVVSDYEALVHIRNCIAHNAGIEQHYRYRSTLVKSVDRFRGFSLDNWHFLGKHICIEEGALKPYIEQLGQFIVTLHKACHDQGLLRDQ